MVVKIDAVAIDVNLLRMDLRKAVDRVTEAEGSVLELKQEVKDLKETVSKLSKMSDLLENRAEDAEGRSRSNFLCFVEFPERVAGQSAKLFLEQLQPNIFQHRKVT